METKDKTCEEGLREAMLKLTKFVMEYSSEKMKKEGIYRMALDYDRNETNNGFDTLVPLACLTFSELESYEEEETMIHFYQHFLDSILAFGKYSKSKFDYTKIIKGFDIKNG